MNEHLHYIYIHRIESTPISISNFSKDEVGNLSENKKRQTDERTK
jgi:hypothetical protein